MAVNIGPRIGIEGEAEYRKSINDIIQQQKTLKSEMEAVTSAFDKSTSAEEKNKKTKDLLTKQVETQKKRVEELSKMLDESAKAFGENDAKTQKWKQAVNEATAELNKMQSELKDIPGGLEEMAGKLDAAGQKMQDAGKAFAPVSAAAAAGLGAAVKTAADFDSAMSKVGAVSGATGDEMAALRKKAREMGATTKFSASEAAEAMNYMAMAGWKTEDMLSGVEGIMNLAAASGESLGTTSDIVTDALTAFGLSAQDSGHFADILAAASSNANTNVSMMGETFKYVAPIAGAMGYSAEDTALAIGLMANSGIKASQAGTSLRAIMTSLQGEITISSAAMGDMVIQTTNADGTMRSFSDILADCREAFSHLTESEAANAAEAIVGQNAMSGFLALMGAGEADVNKLTDALTNADGASQQMAEAMQDNLNGQLTILKSQLEEAAISLGESLMPMLETLVGHLQDAADYFNGLDDSTKQNIATFALAVAAIAPVLIVVGKLASSIASVMTLVTKLSPFVTGTLIPAITGAKTAFLGATVAVGGISAPLWAVVAVVGAVVAAGVLLYKNWDTVKEKATELKDKVAQVWDDIKTTVKNAIDKVKGFLNFEWKLPDLKLPHIVVGAYIDVPVLGRIPDPTQLRVDWYAKAMQSGVILNRPTIFGASGGSLLGAGEAGPEVVVGASSLFEMIRSAVGSTTINSGGNTINVYAAEGQDVRALAEEVASLINGDVQQRRLVWT